MVEILDGAFRPSRPGALWCRVVLRRGLVGLVGARWNTRNSNTQLVTESVSKIKGRDQARYMMVRRTPQCARGYREDRREGTKSDLPTRYCVEG